MFDRLKRLAGDPARQEIAALFAHDPERAATFSVTHDGMLFDYSKTRIDAEARAALVNLAESHEVAARRDAMFAGQAINETEGRAVLHTALRNLAGDPVLVEGRDVMPGVLETLARMEDFADAVRGGGSPGRTARSPTWSISGSAARIWGRRWRRGRFRPVMTGRAVISSRTWTGRIFMIR